MKKIFLVVIIFMLFIFGFSSVLARTTITTTKKVGPKKIAYCIDLWDPVCGSDGKTYSNTCYLGLAKVGLSHTGECYRQVPPKQNNNVSPIKNNPKKTAYCIDLWDPVCGSDGKTYSNTCYLGLAKVGLSHTGECYRQVPPKQNNKVLPVKKVEPKKVEPKKIAHCIDLWDPVCGRDGKTYSNSCFADMARVGVSYYGECKKR